MVCDEVPKSTCQGRHIVVDVMKDVAELKLQLADTKTKMSNHLNEAVAKSEQTQEHLRVMMEQNSSCLKKLRSKIENDAPQLGPSREILGSSSIKKRLEQVVKEAEEESLGADRVLNRVVTISQISVNN